MGKPEMLAKNIGEALICTATGLLIAITAMGFYFFFRNILNSVMTRGRVSIPDLAIEGDLTRDQVKDYIYDLIGKDLFRGYVNWDKGELVSAEAAQIKDGTCPNCGGRLELAGKGLVRCPFCGTETYLSPVPSGVAAEARPSAPPLSPPPAATEDAAAPQEPSGGAGVSGS